MSGALNAIVVACGVATFLLRYLPIRRARSKTVTRKPAPLLDRFLQAIGPAAITALIMVSLYPRLADDFRWPPLIATVLALSIILLAKRLTTGLALPTLAGALAYGVAMHVLGA